MFNSYVSGLIMINLTYPTCNEDITYLVSEMSHQVSKQSNDSGKYPKINVFQVSELFHLPRCVFDTICI